MASGYERNYHNMKRHLADCDFAARAAELGLAAPVDGVLRLEFLGRAYRIDASEVTPETDDGGGDAAFNARTVLIWYLTHGGTGEPGYDFRAIRSFAHGLFDGDRGIAWSRGGDFGLTRERVEAAALRVGARFLHEKNGAWSYLLYALPKIPALITFNEGDDEFPAAVSVKFGSNALNFLPFETLAVLHGLVMGEVRGQR